MKVQPHVHIEVPVGWGGARNLTLCTVECRLHKAVSMSCMDHTARLSMSGSLQDLAVYISGSTLLYSAGE